MKQKKPHFKQSYRAKGITLETRGATNLAKLSIKGKSRIKTFSNMRVLKKNKDTSISFTLFQEVMGDVLHQNLEYRKTGQQREKLGV